MTGMKTLAQRNFVVWLALVVIAGCSSGTSTPEDELREWLEAAELATEERDRRALMSMVSDRYADGRGNDATKLGQMVRAYMLRQQSISLLTKIESITLSGDSAADMSVTVGMAGTNNGALGLSADAYRFELELEHDGDEWLLIGARWAELGDRLR